MPASPPRKSRRARVPWVETAAKLPLWLIPVAVLLVAVAFISQNYLLPVSADETDAVSPEHGRVRLSELMSSNRSALMDDRGNYPDWIELCNMSNTPVNVYNWTVFDGEDRLVGFTFPDQTLAPGEVVLIHASGNLKNRQGYPYHAPFKLSASGDSVVLRDARGALVDRVDCPALDGNQSYALDGHTGTWQATLEYTPGFLNDPANHLQLTKGAGDAAGVLVVNELMADNASYRLPGYGCADYIELKNLGASPIDVGGFMLSDDESRPHKYVLPSRVIEPGGVLLVCASATARSLGDDAPLTPFGLSAQGESVVLSDSGGRLVDRVDYPALGPDRAYSRRESGLFTAQSPPTPGLPNTDAGIAAIERALSAANPVQLLLNEAIAASRQPNATRSTGDWVELHNASGSSIDLTGYGLSDDPSQPRKWRFPSGASVRAGQYLTVQLTGADKSDLAKSQYSTNFSMSYERGETLVLAAPDGTIIDRLPMLNQRAGVSFGRLPGQNGYYYLAEPTPGAVNAGQAYAGRADAVVFSRPGGWCEAGVTVELSAGEGQTVRYTLDASEPGEQSPVYTGPIPIDKTTIVRARAYGDGLLPSLTYTQSYLFGETHTLPVVSLVADPKYLFDPQIGIYTVGPTELKYPYRGANFFKNWERAANVEMFMPDGSTMLSQGTGLQLQGQYSRMEKQKAFTLTARNAYGDPSFDARLFPNRPYDSYRSFLLRSSGQDTSRTRLRDAVLVSLAEDTDVMYQDAVPVVVYLNGEYWGHYNLRERIHKYSIAQRENWTRLDDIDIVKANDNVKQGTNADYAQFLTWLRKNGCLTDENLARVAEMVDIDNYLDYVALQMFIGNTDLLNVKRYRSSEGDGRWRWVLYDTDWAFYTDTDSYRRWLDKAGAGSGKKTDNTLFVQLMKNPQIKDKFLRRFGELMITSWRSETVNAKIDAYARLIEPEMERQSAKWGGTTKRWRSAVNTLKDYANTRPRKMLTYMRKELGFTESQMREYFGGIMAELGL